MIAKKNSRFDLERKRTALFQVGLLAASSFTLAAFTYTSETQSEFEKNVVSYDMISYELVEKEQPKVPEKTEVRPPQTQNNDQQQTDASAASNLISENMDETENSSDFVVTGITIPDLGGNGIGIIQVDEDILDPFPSIEAKYVGGVIAMQQYFNSTIKYPQIDLDLGVEGTVYVSFIVERDGSVSNVNIERGVSETIDREAKRIVRSFPKWIPAENAHGKVRTIARLPIIFKAR